MDAYERRVGRQASFQTPDGLDRIVEEYDAAKRDLETAEEAHRVRAVEFARLAAAVEASIGRVIDEANSERDDLRERLLEAEERLNELEAIRSRARRQGATLPTSFLAAGVIPADRLDAAFYEPVAASVADDLNRSRREAFGASDRSDVASRRAS